MKAFATWVMKGRMQAVVAATVLAVLALLVTPLAMLSAAVVVLTVVRQGWREGALVVGSALLAIAALVVLQYALLENPAAFWAEVLNEFITLRLDEATRETANLAPMIDMLAAWMAGGVAASWFVGTVISLLLARYWQALLDKPGAFGSEFRQLRFGRWLLVAVPALLFGGVLLTGGEPNLLGQIFLVGMLVFLLQGLSVAHALVAEFGGSPAWLFGLYLLLFLVAPQGATMVSLAGYADGWLDFRARARARRPGQGEK